MQMKVTESAWEKQPARNSHLAGGALQRMWNIELTAGGGKNLANAKFTFIAALQM